MTMKMISSTSRMSIIGVMLISHLGPLLGPPTAIAIVRYLASCLLNLELFCVARFLVFVRLFGNESDFIHARRPEVIDDILHDGIPGAGIAYDIYRLVNPVGKQIANSFRELIRPRE